MRTLRLYARTLLILVSLLNLSTSTTGNLCSLRCSNARGPLARDDTFRNANEGIYDVCQDVWKGVEYIGIRFCHCALSVSGDF